MDFQNVPKAFRFKLSNQSATALPEKLIVGLMGEPGTGKTHLATDLCYRWLEARSSLTGLWITTEELLSKYHQGMAEQGKGMEGALKPFLKADILLIDDLFATNRQQKSPGSDTLADIISRRTNDMLKTVWTSNWGKEKILKEVDPRLSDRLLNQSRESCATISKTKITKCKMDAPWILPDPPWFCFASDCYSCQERLISCYVPFQEIKNIPEALAWLRNYISPEWLESMQKFEPEVSEYAIKATLARLKETTRNIDFDAEVV